MTAYLPEILSEMIESEVDTLVGMLKWHDWFYHMSDDPRVFARGYSQRESINEQIKIVNNLSPGLGDETFDCFQE